MPWADIPRVDNMTDAEANFLGLESYYESANQNVKNFRYDDTHTAQGYHQITNTNWRNYAPKMGIQSVSNPGTLAQNAMDASPEDQTRVALALLRDPELSHTIFTDD